MKVDTNFDITGYYRKDGRDCVRSYTHIMIEDDHPITVALTGNSARSIKAMRKATLRKFHELLGLQLAGPLEETITD